MKDLNGLGTHLQGDNVKTICNCLKITSALTTDVYYFTDAHKDVTVDGNLYHSEATFTITNVKKSIGTSVDTLTISDVHDPVSFSGNNFGEIARKKLLEGASVDLYLVNFEDTDEFYQDFKGFVSRVKVKDFTVDLELEGLASLYLQNIMKTYEHTCILTFGDDECTFVLSTKTVTGSVTSVTDRSTFKDNTRTEADNYFRFGVLTWTSGNNAGLTREIKSYDGVNTEFVFYQPMPYPIVATDAYSVYQGCDKDPDTCKDEFDNFENFQGYLNLVPPAEKLTYTPPDDPDLGSE